MMLNKDSITSLPIHFFPTLHPAVRDTPGYPQNRIVKAGGDISPVAVGGVGGSGTRVIANALTIIGYYIGDDLNEALDNLWFTLFFRRRSILLEDELGLVALIKLFLLKMSGNSSLPAEAFALVSQLPMRHHADLQHQLVARVNTFISGTTVRDYGQPWGWKEPNTHIIIERMLRECPELLYVHVNRHPLDMSLSSNQNQLSLWGPLFLNRDIVVDPTTSLSYWCAAHRRITTLSRNMPHRVHMVDFNSFCGNPEQHCLRLAEFLHARIDAIALIRISAAVRKPASAGRFSGYDLGLFDPADLSYVREIGYTI